MKTISIISHKGGAGKTSSAVMLAEELVRRGCRVVLVDADRQRGAGLLLGLDQTGSGVQQTSNPRLRYFCCSGLPLREIPSRAEELRGLFDVAVVDTPSLDDPLARTWIQLSSAALMVLPVEPVSVKTLDGADSALNAIRKLNPQIQELGILPTMLDETDATQRTLMLELRARRSETLLSPAIPHDPNLLHRADQRVERRTVASPATQKAYEQVTETLLKALDLGAVATPALSFVTPAPRRAPSPAQTAAKATTPAASQASAKPAFSMSGNLGRSSGFRWVLVALLTLVLLAIGYDLISRNARSHGASDGSRGTNGAHLAGASFSFGGPARGIGKDAV